MLSKNVPSTFLVEGCNFHPVSEQSELKFIAHLMHSLMVERVTSLNDLCTASTKRLVGQKQKQIIDKSQVNMKTLLSEYV